MFLITADHRRAIEEKVLTFDRRHPMPLPDLWRVGRIPLKTPALREPVMPLHTLEVYISDTYECKAPTHQPAEMLCGLEAIFIWFPAWTLYAPRNTRDATNSWLGR